MGKVMAFTNVTLDGVMQAPARPDEDRRGGFQHGGWAAPYAAMQHAGGQMSFGGGLIFGRRTYEDFYDVWPKRKESPFSAMLDNMPKFVASRTLDAPLPWQNSTLLEGDGADAVTRLKQASDQDFLIFGSGDLIQSLMRAQVIDEFVLLIHPLVLGSGRRLFPEGSPSTTLHLTKCTTTPTGVVVATMVPTTTSGQRAEGKGQK